jgi:hypothetical protein
VRARRHDLAPFLGFALNGITRQVQRLLIEIQHEMRKALFQNVMYRLFGRMATKRRRVMAQRQLDILQIMLGEKDPIRWGALRTKIGHLYAGLRKPDHAMIRDLGNLLYLKTLGIQKNKDGVNHLAVRLEWPTEITETEFFRQIKNLPKAKAHTFIE